MLSIHRTWLFHWLLSLPLPASRTCLSDFLFFYVLCLLFVFPLPGKTVSTAIVLNEQRWGSTSEVLIFTFYLSCDNRHTSVIFPFFRIFLNFPTQSLLSAESGFWCGVRMIVWVIFPDVWFFLLDFHFVLCVLTARTVVVPLQVEYPFCLHSTVYGKYVPIWISRTNV